MNFLCKSGPASRLWQSRLALCMAMAFGVASLAASAATSTSSAAAPEPEPEVSSPSRNGTWNPAIPAEDQAPISTRTLAETNVPASLMLTGSDLAGHTIKTGDVLDVKVFQEDDLSGRSRVAQDGTVTLPLLGQIKVAGLTMEAATRHLHKLLGDDYLVNPQVLVSLVETAKPKFTILGQVQAPGMYELPEGEELRLLQAISLAGGYTRLANPGRITLKRTVGGAEVVKQFDGKALAKGRDAKPERVLAGDTIYVPERVF